MATDTLNPRSWLYPTPRGLYCEPGDFYVDPAVAVARAVITHGHGDHARPSHRAALATPETLAIVRARFEDMPKTASSRWPTARPCGTRRVFVEPMFRIRRRHPVRVGRDFELLRRRSTCQSLPMLGADRFSSCRTRTRTFSCGGFTLSSAARYRLSSKSMKYVAIRGLPRLGYLLRLTTLLLE